MLHSAIRFLADQADAYIRSRTGATQASVDIGGFTDDGGKWTLANPIRLALVGVEEERTVREQMPESVYVDGRRVMLEPPIKLNLVVVFAARIGTSYLDTLRYLSYVITCFQAHPAFTPEEFPGLDPAIERLAPELLSYGPEQLNQMWAYIGTKYLPSVAYRVRMVVLQDVAPRGVEVPITTVHGTLHNL